jgi:hypothetical protein
LISFNRKNSSQLAAGWLFVFLRWLHFVFDTPAACCGVVHLNVFKNYSLAACFEPGIKPQRYETIFSCDKQPPGPFHAILC